MNAVEIEEAISDLAERPFDRDAFPFAFLEAFGNKATTIRKLRSGTSNGSDLARGVLQRGNIHIATCDDGTVDQTLIALRDSPKTVTSKAKFILATDGIDFQAEDLSSGETVACRYADFPDHFGLFLPLAGITTVKQIRESTFDIRATSRLNKLYIELLNDNPEWATTERRTDMNHFMARLIFCFFAEDTDIFRGESLFTRTVEQMSARDSGNTHEIISQIFQAMDTPTRHEGKPDNRYRDAARIPRWADPFPYVNGQLFSGNTDVPSFSRIARSFLIQIGNLNWRKINPDIFGSMIQAVADEEERGSLGMHYTSVPNILKVLNPLFLDDLRAALDEAGDNPRKLLNLRNRMARIRVFDPACGSGNFLVIAYKQMREIEFEINARRGDSHRKSVIPLTNFRGIEVRDFPAEIARLALIIAEFQCDVSYRGQKEALADFLPLDSENWIVCGNALRLDWLSLCPPQGTGVKVQADDLFSTPLNQTEIDFENEGGETYICGNPPYAGKGKKSESDLEDMEMVFGRYGIKHGYIDYVGCWFVRAVEYAGNTDASFAFVSTNSICQGHQVPLLWPEIFRRGFVISFAHTSFKWSNLASNNAGVTVAIVGLSRNHGPRRIYVQSANGETFCKIVENINAYLVPSANIIVEKRSSSVADLAAMDLGNMPYDGGNLLMSRDELEGMGLSRPDQSRFTRRIFGSKEFISNLQRHCLWIDDAGLADALVYPKVKERIDAVREMRLSSTDKGGRTMAARAHQLREMKSSQVSTIVMPRTSSESREYLPAGIVAKDSVVSSEAFAIYDGPLWQLSLLMSKMHLVWIATVCGQLETRYRYSNVLGWNTFPVPKLTQDNRIALTRCAEDILLAREVNFPATIAELYEVRDGQSRMPENLRHAHEHNDELLERIYIGRKFRNDTERLEKLFELYTKMTRNKAA